MDCMKHAYPIPARPASFVRLADGKIFVLRHGEALGVIIPHVDAVKPHRRYRLTLAGRHRGYSGNVFRAVRWMVRQGS